ncbi:peptidoglycan/LPS O-acetylase OafA/YrhL [Paraburkholderia sp. BL23I1N1]|uniref:acyltransferase family protein n=1 Tax=Paraburkholderia sp. BL23I1N1 TaxID=1938802 RepID=UPI000FF20ECA|nr:acyltransferase [Paraburkholderia sp. BL23I1N1]RKE36627.1 peptidoglycan/LPS O-acetylase OafA/YrhL [Paraburkholderia sp. BL23I1N1]
MKKQAIPALTGLRFVAAAAIVLDHLWPVIFKLNPGVPFADPFHQLSFLGMSLFFVLSGFIIHYNYSDTVGSTRGLYDFAVARFSRLYPLFFALAAFDVICGNFFLYAPDAYRLQDLEALSYLLAGVQSWVYGFIGDSPIAFAFHYTFVAWSISTEFFLYLTYPIICLLMLRAGTPRRAVVGALAIGAMAAVALSLLKQHTAFIDHVGALIGIVENPKANPGTLFSDWFNYIAPYSRVLEFLTGCAIAQAHMVLARRSVGIRELRFARLAIAIAVVNIALFVLRNELGSPRLAAVVGIVGLLPAIATVIFCCARYSVKPLSYAPLVALGEASYSMYLLHMIVIEKSAPGVSVDATPENIAIFIGRTVIILAAIAVISLGTHRYFEQPARRFLRRLLSPRVRSIGARGTVSTR